MPTRFLFATCRRPSRTRGSSLGVGVLLAGLGIGAPALPEATGSDRASLFLREAIRGEAAVDIVLIGDSNTGFGGAGWLHGLAHGCHELAPHRNYGSPVVPLTDGPQLGYGLHASGNLIGRSSANGSGVVCRSGSGQAGSPPESLATAFGRGSGNLHSTGTPLDWAWFEGPSNGTFVSNFAAWYLAGGKAPSPLRQGKEPLVYRVVRGAHSSAASDAGFHVTWVLGSSATVTAVPTSSGASDGQWHWIPTEVASPFPAGSSPTANLFVSCAGGGSGQGIRGACALALHSVFRRTGGWSVSALSFRGGATLTNLRDDIAGIAGPGGALATFLHEYRGRQASTGHPGRVIFWIQGGINLTDWWFGPPPAPDMSHVWSDRIVDIASIITAAWTDAGMADDDLAFVAMPSHQANASDSPLRVLRERARELPSRVPNLTAIDPAEVVTYQELAGPPSLYDSAGPSHLTPHGFRFVGERLIRTLYDQTCPGDLHPDDQVNAADLGILLSEWGRDGWSPADINRDGTVGASDLAALLGAWGPCSTH